MQQFLVITTFYKSINSKFIHLKTWKRNNKTIQIILSIDWQLEKPIILYFCFDFLNFFIIKILSFGFNFKYVMCILSFHFVHYKTILKEPP